MPIPAFDAITNVLPPHLGDPRRRAELTPFPCTIDEVCARFATSSDRVQILNGFLDLRKDLRVHGIRGFQWVNGSFVEDVEQRENRPPDDIDVVTYAVTPDSVTLNTRLTAANRLDLLDHVATKVRYRTDHFLLALDTQGALIVDFVRYFGGLFSHRRDGTWKGMLKVSLGDQTEDAGAAKNLAAVAKQLHASASAGS